MAISSNFQTNDFWQKLQMQLIPHGIMELLLLVIPGVAVIQIVEYLMMLLEEH